MNKVPEPTLPEPSSNATSGPLIVGVGASAGGLDAFKELLVALGDSPGLAVVFIQHMDSSSKSLLLGLLQSTTSMDVVEINNRKKLKANKVYLCPPQATLELKNGFVRVAKADEKSARKTKAEPTDVHRQWLAIDHFFHSIAEDQSDRGIGVILSGGGSDGTLGLKAISDCGGLTFAQEPTSAKHDSMPRSAATTGVADHVLTPANIGVELLRYAAHLADVGDERSLKETRHEIIEAIPAITETLFKVTEHNFQHYKITTLCRRIQRRMQVLQISDASGYVSHLENHEDEAHSLFRELLIGVTHFFRDPDAFESLSDSVLTKIFAGRSKDDTVRIWVAGCANGSEPYTLAILCRETMERLNVSPEVQIFATDIDERALDVGRAGVYPIGIEEHVSPERLKRFFVKRGKRYHATKEIRELILFSSHNLISDPPFSRQDLICCRNLLIYLGSHLQNKLIPLFHYALRPSGHLFLGPSETITTHGELFRPHDAQHRISQRKGTAIGTPARPSQRTLIVPATSTDPLQHDPHTDLTSMRQRILLDEFAPKSCVIDADGQVLNSDADMNKYLSVGGGDFHNNIIKMAAKGLRIGLRAAINEATKTLRKVQHENMSIRDGDKTQEVMVTVQPMPQLGEDEQLFMVVFHDVGLSIDRTAAGSPEVPERDDADSIITQMETELQTTRDDLERTMQDMEAANEELKSSNEELLSMNEELQSANEELATSKEETRASVDEVGRAHATMENLLRSTQIATVFLDEAGLVQWFSPSASEIYNLIPTDIGRPLRHITHNMLEMTDINGGASQPTAKAGKERTSNPILPREDEIQRHDGRWYLRRVLPFLRGEKHDGVIITFVDVTTQKLAALRQATEHSVAEILTAAESFSDVVQDILDSIRTSLRADICSLWLVDSQSKSLRCEKLSIQPGDHHLEQFADKNGKVQFSIGEGLPGRVWKSRKPQWIVDVANDPTFKRAEASEIGLHTSMAMPIIVSDQCYGVIELFTYAQIESDRAILGMLRSVGLQIGQFINRRRLDEELRDQESRKSAIMKASLDAIITMDTEGRVVDFNPAAERTFGYSSVEVIGRPMAEILVPTEDREAHANGLHRYLQTGESTVIGQRTELTALRADGSKFPIEIAINAATTRRGEPFFTAYLRDITAQKQFVDSIQDREAQLRRVIDNTLGFIGVLEPDGTLLEANSPALKAGGLTRDDVVGRKFWDLYWWNYSPEVMDEVKRLVAKVASGEAIRKDMTYRISGDDRRPLDFMMNPIFDADGKVTYLIPSGLDICDRKRTERELADSKVRFDLALEYGEIAVWSWDMNANDVIVDDNLRRLFGFEQNADVHLFDLLQRIDEADRNRVEAAIEHSIANAEVFDEEYRVNQSPGVTRWMRGRGRTRQTNEGKVADFFGVISDITARKHSERAIKDYANRLKMALKAGGLAAWQWSPGQSFWTSEVYDLLGISSDRIAGPELIFEVIHPDDLSRFQQWWQDAVGGTKPCECEFRIIRQSEVRWIVGVGEVIRNDAGKVVRMSGLYWDSTSEHLQADALRESEQRALRANKSKSEFLANMSHEIRTPMTAILGYADLLSEYVQDDEGRQHLSTIRRNGDFLLDIINDILDLSKIEAGKLEFVPEHFSPQSVIEDVRSIMEVRASENGLSLDVEYETDLPLEVESDAKRLKQILINLVGNAIKFTKEGGVRITIAYDRHGNRSSDQPQPQPLLRFRVIDTGIGITAEQQEKLFQPFSQADGTVTRDFGGTGLGLAISRRLAKMLGGDISIQSESGVGSTFEVTIAAGDVEDSPSTPPASTEAPAALTQQVDSVELNCHILIVDDSRDIRFLSKRILSGAGAEVTEAEDGQEAIEIVEQAMTSSRVFDMVLLDMQMPKLDGYQTATQLRQLGFAGPIIALTADAMHGDMNRCIESGCNDYLSKPIDAGLLLSVASKLTT